MIEQKKEEEKREKKVNMMFSEEAENFWEKQEKIWKDEKRAREQLMDDVLSGWKNQIDSKIQGFFQIFNNSMHGTSGWMGQIYSTILGLLAF